MTTFRGIQVSDYDVVEIGDDRLVLNGGGDFYESDDGDVDEGTWARAREIAKRFGMTITSAHGEWWGWSEYTPDPGDVSVFAWSKA